MQTLQSPQILLFLFSNYNEKKLAHMVLASTIDLPLLPLADLH